MLVFQEPAENLECPELIAAFIAEQKEKEKEKQHTSNVKRSHSNNNTNDNDTDEVNNNNSPTKRPRIEVEQTGYHRGLVPEMLMGATDIYDGELMFL